MADEILRRNLDRVFDPGPDFPNPLLLSRTMAYLDAEAKTGGRRQERRSRGRSFGTTLSPRATQLVAAALVLVVAAAGIAAFLAIYQYAHRSIPIRTHRVAASGTCYQGFHMVSPTVGWRGAVSRTTDGGTTWRDVPPPSLPNFSKGGVGECILDATHAWTTQATGTSFVSATQLYVFATADGGATWKQGAPVPASGANMGVALEFIDPQDGWLLTYTGSDASPALTRTLYATADGGLHWSRVASGSQSSGSSLGQLAGGCSVTGMTFASTDKGWLTWDCSRGDVSQPQSGGPVVAGTIDGGRTWTSLSLPLFPGTSDWTCGASPPVLSGNQGVLAVSCSSSHGGWAGVYRTSDSGGSWKLSQLPVVVQLSQIEFVDATTGFVFAGVGTSDLYRTIDSGSNWALITKNVFSGQGVGEFQFLDANIGFAYTSTGGPWTTTDGGATWSLPGQRVLPGNVGCPSPSRPIAGSPPVPILMATSTTGWAIDARHTTDGGAHWSSDGGPPSIANRSSGYAEFFLDATHAWVAETGGSSAACSDHIVVVSTSDGGQTWQPAPPIPVALAAPSEAIWSGASTSYSPTTILSLNQSHLYGLGGPWLDFVDANHGWLLVETQAVGLMALPKVGPLYRTTDGGLHWTLVSELPAAIGRCGVAGGISFISTTTGWMPEASGCDSSAPLMYRVTHDGGATWTDQTLSLACGCIGTAPVFFDGRNGSLVAGDYLFVTSDGGTTWNPQPLTPGSLQLYAIDLIGPSQGWSVTSVNDTDFSLRHTSNGGKTWTVVNPHLPPPASDSRVSYRLTFIDAQIGFWANGSDLYKTTDGGHTWTALQGVS
jgi:photosystem II stability/assembly factor-like uncharacterized protein